VQEDAEPLEIKEPFRWDGRARVRHLPRSRTRVNPSGHLPRGRAGTFVGRRWWS